MGDKITDLAVRTFTSQPPEDDHAERHNYYKELTAKQSAGQKLAPHEAKWLAAARQAVESDVAKKDKFYRDAGQTDTDKLMQYAGYNRDKYGAFYQQQNGGPQVPKLEIGKAQVAPVKPVTLQVGKASVEPVRTSPVTLEGNGSAVASMGRKGGQQVDIANKAKVEEYDPRSLTPLGHYAVGVGSLPKGNAWEAFKEGATGIRPGMSSPMPLAGQPTAPPAAQPGSKPVYSFSDEELGARRTAPDYKFSDKELRGNTRTLDRRPSDASMQDHDSLGQSVIERTYGKHLKAVDDNDGKFPAGYFDNMDAATKQNIKAGVTELIRRRRGIRT